MRLGADKTDAMSFEAGFCFLGEDFGTRYPPVIEDRIDVPDERTVFVAAAGSRVRIDQGRVVVERDEQELLDVPAGLVARIVCFGPVGVTAGLRNWALSSGVELVFCSQRAATSARSSPDTSTGSSGCATSSRRRTHRSGSFRWPGGWSRRRSASRRCCCAG